MTQTKELMTQPSVAEKPDRGRLQEATGRSEESPKTEEQGMPGAVIHETPIALADARFGPETCMWVTDAEELVLASGTNYAAVAAVGKAACKQHGFELHQASLESAPETHPEKVDSPEESEE